MKSKGGMVDWLCPFCLGEEIHKEHIPMSWAALLPEDDIRYQNYYYETANYGYCSDCEEYFPWTARMKRTKKGKKFVLTAGNDLHWLHRDAKINNIEEADKFEGCRNDAFYYLKPNLEMKDE